MSYAFRLTVSFPPAHYLDPGERRLTLRLPDFPAEVIISAVGDESLDEADRLALHGRGYKKDVEALSQGRVLQNALRVAGVITGSGIDVGDETARSGVGRALGDLAQEYGKHLLDDVHGLQVFEDTGNEMVFMASATTRISQPFDGFRDAILSGLGPAARLTASQTLACDLYAAAGFEVSARARLLALVTAAEVLAERPERTGPGRNLVEDLIRRAIEKRAAMSDEIESLLGGLRDLRKQSVSRIVVELAAKYGGEEPYGIDRLSAARVMKTAYSVRSELVHGGKTEHRNLAGLAGDTTLLMRSIILAHAGV